MKKLWNKEKNLKYLDYLLDIYSRSTDKALGPTLSVKFLISVRPATFTTPNDCLSSELVSITERVI